MLGLILCGAAFLATFLAGRRSLVHGLAALLAVGYFYGILRANAASALSYFIFDAAVVGLYLTQLFKPLPALERIRIQPLLPWLGLLIGWPVFLLVVPIQDPMIQLVGLRAHIFFLPFLLLGARLRQDDLRRLAGTVAVLNLIAFGFAVAEFFLGVEAFFPRNEVTDLIYKSNDIRTSASMLVGAYRIPSTFAHAGAYGGVMVITLPLLMGRWTQKDGSLLQRHLITAALAATVLGVFLSASRMHFLVLMVIVLIATLSGQLGMAGQMAWVVTLGGVGWLVSTQQRLFQRLMSLSFDTLLERLSWGVNESFLSLMVQYPLGNGLGGGGNSIPYFLRPLIRNPVAMENQYAAIMLEQGFPGLVIWVAFIVWALSRRTTHRSDPWYLGRRLVWYVSAAYLAQGLIGVGLLTAVPFTVIFLLLIGWMVVRPTAPTPATAAPVAHPAETYA